MLTISKFTSSYIINKNTNCWEWTAGRSSVGYGMMWVDGKMVYSHRWSYEYFIGLIPDTYQIDHLCRIRYCVNPNHLEAVTQQENIMRGDHSNIGIKNREKTHCPKGHEYSSDNIYKTKNNGRRCAACAKQQSKIYYKKVKK